MHRLDRWVRSLAGSSLGLSDWMQVGFVYIPFLYFTEVFLLFYLYCMCVFVCGCVVRGF